MNFSRAIIVSVLVPTAFCCLPFAAIQAEESASGFVLLIDEEAPGAAAMLDNRYEEAANVAAAVIWQGDAVGAGAVLCAALIASRELHAAASACDNAVVLARRPITTVSNPHGHRDRDALAMAHSNRAVLRWLRGDIDGANADVLVAMRQNRYVDEVRHNSEVGATATLARGH